MRGRRPRIGSPVQLYEETVADLELSLKRVEAELERCSRTCEERPRLEGRRDRLWRDVEEARRRFQADQRELEDAKLALEAEIEELVEAAAMLDWLG